MNTEQNTDTQTHKERITRDREREKSHLLKTMEILQGINRKENIQ